ncbi:MAG: enoyl-CoA hydratase [Gammaproteobacteria bacterium]
MVEIDTGTDQLLCSKKESVATITFNRPEKRNALSNELTPALRETLLHMEADQDVRCIVLTGAGNAFCAGGDVSQMGGGVLAKPDERSYEGKIRDLQLKQRTLTLRLYELKTPTIAALPGPAAGAGLSIALACDIRIAKSTAFVTTGYANIGLSGDYGASWFLNQLVGPSMAKELCFTSRRIPVTEAHALGIINHVVNEGEYESEVAKLAAEIAGGPPVAIGYMKEHINRAFDTDLGTYLDIEAEHLLRCAQTEDHNEAVSAFMQKRSPVFQGK